ncbi:MAG: biotin--[acetyl-CoA-carboxylase] ligase [Clostridia bacterium]|nr:biotin--[acetyl-CoA-carboxylase] ligase [Clostridia bacterium]
MKIEHLTQVDSTNLYIRRYLPAGENVIVTADMQTGGKGTKGRGFLSDRGGVYLSALTFYSGFPAEQAFRVMAHAAVSVCRTAEAFGVVPEIKWANDVFVSGRKLSGILIENGFSGSELKWSIVGIGVNAENDLSQLRSIAVSLTEAAGRHITAEEAREKLIENYCKPSSFEEYLSYIRFLGNTVYVTEGEKNYRATALRILSDGRLEIDDGDKVRALSAAEISLKLGD